MAAEGMKNDLENQIMDVKKIFQKSLKDILL